MLPFGIRYRLVSNTRQYGEFLMTQVHATEIAPEASGTASGRGRLAGRRVLVVGAGQQTFGIDDAPVGNGRAISVLCGREGANVAVADIDAAGAAATAAQVEAEGARALALSGDAADETDVARVTG